LCDRVIPEDGVPTENPSAVKKLVFCSGKVFYDLMKARNEKNLDRDIAIARVEQVQIIFFCCKIHLFGLFKYSSFISLMV
jgi:2-oxoglutarate dehydrogenase complex dehydrogenase (E1) component-like enzyme